MKTNLAYQREVRKKNGNLYTRRYEKTKKGFLMRLYRNMQSRVTGIQHKKAHLYKGLSLLDRDTFYEWALNHPDFTQMFDDWVASGHDRKLTPTVDRIDSSNGYVLNNMRWLTHSVNSSRRMNAGH
jgi:hypothetical protein